MQGGNRLQLRLLPLDDSVSQAMHAAGYNPYLEILCRTSKSLVSVLRHLSTKWQAAAPRAADQQQGSTCEDSLAYLHVHPCVDSCPISLRGMRWGGPNCDRHLKVQHRMMSARGTPRAGNSLPMVLLTLLLAALLFDCR